MRNTVSKSFIRIIASLVFLAILSLLFITSAAVDEATETSLTLPQVVESLNLTNVPADRPEVERKFRVTNPNSFPVDFEYRVAGTSETGSLTAAPGYTFFTVTAPSGNNVTVIISWIDGNGATQSKTKASNNTRAKYNLTTFAENGTILPASGSYEFGTTVAISSTANEGYRFVRYDSNVILNESNEVVISKDTTVTAIFELIPPKVNDLRLVAVPADRPEVERRFRVDNLNNPFDVDFTWEIYNNVMTGSGTATGGTSTYFTVPGELGKNITVKIYWKNEEGATKSTVKASNDTRAKYNLITLAENGTILPLSGSYEFGTTVAITASPNSGYRFVRFESNATLDANNSVLIEKDTTVTAVFELIPTKPYYPPYYPPTTPVVIEDVESLQNDVEISDTESNMEIPRTGDASASVIYLVLISLVALVTVFYCVKREKMK